MRHLLLLLLCLSASWSAEVGSAMWFIQSADADYARRAVLSAMCQVRVCRLAEGRLADQQLLAMARQVANHAARTTEELSAMAARKGFNLPIELDAEHRLVVEGLQRCRRGEFLRRWHEAVAAGTRESIAIALAQAERGTDPDFRAFARLDGEAWKECSRLPEVLASSR